MRKYKKAAGLLAVSLVISMCSGWVMDREKSNESQAGETANLTDEDAEIKKAAKQDINEVHLRDKDTLYENDDETSVVTMYLTVSRGNVSENTDHSWKEINNYSVYDYDTMGVERYQAAALLQVGDEDGPQQGAVGYGETAPNATVQVRGQTSSENTQKNYKIELKKNKGTWRGQRTINLNKHMGEGMRFRNKLAYDLNGQLYKINSFEFYRYEDVIKKEDDADYNQKKFEKYLEIKGNSDHSKLIEMLDTVNDYSIPIDEILNQYFDMENITYWMAYQILTGNVDTQNRNTYIYSPLNSDTWYFISWDNDGSFMRTEYQIRQFADQGSWESGISNYWGNVLFQRCLKSQTFRDKLNDAILDLKENYLTEDRLATMIESYKSVVKSYAYSMPDQMNEPLTEAQYDQVSAAIPGEVETNYQLYLESLEKPMPFFIGVPVIEDNKLELAWDVSYDFDAEDITYTVEVAKDYLFQDVIYRSENQPLPEMAMDVPEAGQYFVRVRAGNKSGYTQDAFDYYVTDSGKNYGMKCFYVTEDNQIEEDTYDEK